MSRSSDRFASALGAGGLMVAGLLLAGCDQSWEVYAEFEGSEMVFESDGQSHAWLIAAAANGACFPEGEYESSVAFQLLLRGDAPGVGAHIEMAALQHGAAGEPFEDLLTWSFGEGGAPQHQRFPTLTSGPCRAWLAAAEDHAR